MLLTVTCQSGEEPTEGRLWGAAGRAGPTASTRGGVRSTRTPGCDVVWRGKGDPR